MHVVLIMIWLLLVEILQSHCLYITYLPLPVMSGNIWICIIVSKKKLAWTHYAVFGAENLKIDIILCINN